MKQYFPSIPAIPFEGIGSKNPLAYRYYDRNRVVMGKKMSEWLKFAMCWWHTLCAEGADQFGPGTKIFPFGGLLKSILPFALTKNSEFACFV